MNFSVILECDTCGHESYMGESRDLPTDLAVHQNAVRVGWRVTETATSYHHMCPNCTGDSE